LNPLLKKIKELNVRPQKKWGQHFVIDPGVTERIVDLARVDPEDWVLEIGGGVGSLTLPLAQRAKKVYTIEIDPQLVKALRQEFLGNHRVEVLEGDALRLDWTAIFSKFAGKGKVIANLPYEISSPMIFRLFEERAFFSSFVLMFQWEVAQRIVALPGTRDYGPMSIWSKVYTKAQVVMRVSPGSFYPRPKVDSAVVKFEILEKPSVDLTNEKIFRRVVRSAFNYRRKTLANALRTAGAFAHLSVSQMQEILEDVGIDARARGETLTLAQFRDLSEALSK